MAVGAVQLQSRAAAATVVGTIEAIGRLGDVELVVSGWSRQRPEAGSSILAVTETGALVEGRWWAAWSDRPDVGPGTGFTGIIEMNAALSAEHVLGVRLDGSRALRLYEQRTLLDTRQCISLLRSSGAGQGFVSQPVLAAAAARYDGSDTISTSSLPVRIGIDDCVSLPDAIMISGWIVDPEKLVERAWIAGSSRRSPLDSDWLRRSRPDVTAALAAEPRFALHSPLQSLCGFTAIVPAQDLGDDARLTIELAGTMLHMPLQPRTGNPLHLLRSILSSIDPDAPSSLDIVDRYIAPVLARLPSHRPELTTLSRSWSEQHPIVLVIASCGDAEEVPALLAIIAPELARHQLPVLVVAPKAELDAFGGAIERAAQAFSIDMILAAGVGIEDASDAVGLAAFLAPAESLLVLSAAMVPWSGWLSTMIDACSSGRVVVAEEFDASRFGPEPAQRQAARLAPGIASCLAPRHVLLEAFKDLHPCLDASLRSRKYLEAIRSLGHEVDTAEGAEVLNTSLGAPSRLLGRADQRADALRQSLSLGAA